MLNVDNITLYYGAAQALRGVSLTAEPGKVTCVLGRNGVGKTSLLRAMVGQYPIKDGSITFDGVDLGPLRPYERARKGIGFVPAGPRDISAADGGGKSQDRFRSAQAHRPQYSR